MRSTLFIAFGCGLLLLEAQTRVPPAPADYGQFETLAGGGGRGGAANGFSPDGKWLAYGITRSNAENELRVAKVAEASTMVVAFGTQPVFSSDSKWMACRMGYSESQTAKLRADNKPVQNKLGLMNLTTGEQTSIDGIVSFAFSPSGEWLAFRRYAPGGAPEAGAGRGGRGGGGGGRGGGAAAEDENPVGATLVIRNLANGRDTTLGNVSDYAWQDVEKKGHLLAVAISTDDKTGNGLEIFDTATGTLRAIDSSSSVYGGLSWRKDSADLAALRSITDEKRDGPANTVLAWSHVGEAGESMHSYQTMPEGMRIVPYRKPAWSDDGASVFVGVAAWDEKPPAKKGGRGASASPEEEVAGVDIWHWKDADVMPKQKKSAAQDQRKNMLAVWHPESGKFVQLAHDVTSTVMPLKHKGLAYELEWKAYAMARSIGRPEADLSLIDTATGNATKIKDGLKDDRYLQASPSGKYLLYVQNDHYWTVDTSTHAIVNITKTVKTSFIDKESDETVPQLPPFGVAGWTKDDRDVILYDKFDLWRVAADGSNAVRLTDGAAEQIRYRHARLDSEEEFIDNDKPVYLSMFGIWSKKSGYAVLKPGAKAETLLWADKSIDRLMKAKDADVYAYVSQTFVESPNEFVGGPELKDAKKVSDTNPFQAKYAWSKEELVDYKNPAGVRLQGALYYPAGYEPGKKYPMVVYMYEKLSDGLHHYNAPSERSYYSASAITSHGYFLLMPDIVFRPHEPGASVAECVSAAVKKVLASGMVDEKKVGILGHSWGGFDSVFLATHTNIFAAAVAGAPITDLVSNYGNHHWSSGIAETDHIETGQQRMQVPIYEDLQAYIRNSAVFNVQNMTTPLLIEVGDSDGTVFFHQGVELYNIARRAKKEVVLIEYAGEDHGLTKKADQIDYQHRIFAWFGHYLKGEPAEGWIENGQSYLDRQKELKKKP
jgi:dipeptidyl aminopeptidase/acylaminoacyl peptidase